MLQVENWSDRGNGSQRLCSSQYIPDARRLPQPDELLRVYPVPDQEVPEYSVRAVKPARQHLRHKRSPPREDSQHGRTGPV